MIDITQTGTTAHEAVDRDGTVLSQHARQDKAIETVVNAGGGEVRTAQVLRITVTDPEPAPGYVDGWGVPAWEDTFDGGPDADIWTVWDDTYLSYDWGVIQAGNVQVEGGNAVLQVTRRDVPQTFSDGRVRGWDTCYLLTRGRREARYGRWEMRAQLPTVADGSSGVWPAFWLRNGSTGEIDIMEAWGDPTVRSRPADMVDTSGFTVHEDTNGVGRKVGRIYEHETGADGPPYSTSAGFHVWAVEYTPDHLKAFMDGRLAVHLTPAGTPWVWGDTFASPWHVRLNVQMGDPYWTPDPDPSDGSIVTPARFVVDYVRFWALP